MTPDMRLGSNVVELRAKTRKPRILIAGEFSAGKTQLISALLYTAGASTRLGRVDDGVVHVRARDEDPPDRVGVDREKGIPINGEVGKRYARRVGERRVGKERPIGHVVVGFLALVISEQDTPQGECSRKEHRDGHDEDRGPKTEAPLPRRGNRACRSGRTHMRAPVELRFPSPSTIRGHTRLSVGFPTAEPAPRNPCFR